MRFAELMKAAMSSILSRKVRSFLTSLGVIIGVFAVAALLSVGEASIRQMQNLMQGLNPNTIQASVYDDSTKLKAADVEELNAHEGVKAAAPYIQDRGTAKSGLNETNVTIIGTTSTYAVVKDCNLAAGRFLLPIDVEEKNDAAILGWDVALKLFGHTDIIGQQVLIEGRELTVVGVLQETETTLSENMNQQVILPISTGQELYDMGDINQFVVLADSAEQIDAAKSAVKRYLDEEVEDANNYSINASDDLNEYMDESNKTMMALLGGVGGISLVVSGIGIMNIMLVSVTERTREIGIRKAVGATRRSIVAQFLSEAVVISVLGGLIGIALGLIAGNILAIMLEIEPVIQLGWIAGGIASCCFIGVGFGTYPAWKASNLDPIDALRYE
jgi:putative ABC transport system permease protein